MSGRVEKAPVTVKDLVIDCTSVTDRVSGMERYTREVAIELVPLAIDAGYRVTALFAKGANWFPAHAPDLDSNSLSMLRSPFRSRLLTEQCWIPWLLRRFSAATCFFPAFPPALAFFPLRGRKKVVKTVYDAVMWRHSNTLSWKNKAYMRPLETFWINRYDIIHTISNYSRQEVEEVFPSLHAPFIASGIGIPYERFAERPSASALERVRKKYALPGSFLLFVGTLEPRKNLPFLFEVFDKVRQIVPGIDLVLAGRFGWGAEAVREQVERLDLTRQVHLTGSVEDEDLPALYALASLMVFPSLYEGFGLPVVEAMAAGIPVIASNTSSIPEAAGDAAILLPPSDTDAWVQAILQVLVDESKAQRMVAQGKEQARRFTWRAVAERILKSL